MPIAAVVVGGLAAAGGAYLSYKGQKSANKQNRKQWESQLGFEYEKWGEYLKDLESRRTAVTNERKGREGLVNRKFAAALQNWDMRTSALDKRIGMWKSYEDDPTKVPAWRAFNEAITGEARKAIKGLSGQMERAGRTGGSQDRMRGDVSDRLLSRLGSQMLTIQEQARGKQLELEGMKPDKPFKDYLGDPELSGTLSQYGGSLPNNQQDYQPIDLSGFGMLASQMYNQGTTVNVEGAPSWSLAGNLPGDQRDYQPPRERVLGV